MEQLLTKSVPRDSEPSRQPHTGGEQQPGRWLAHQEVEDLEDPGNTLPLDTRGQCRGGRAADGGSRGKLLLPRHNRSARTSSLRGRSERLPSEDVRAEFDSKLILLAPAKI